MKKKISLCISGSLLALATVASAGNQEGAFSISPVVGGYTANGIPSKKFDTDLLVGGRLGYNFTKAIGVEGLFDYSPRENSTNFYRYGGELLYHFMPDNKFVPYIAAGYAGFNVDKGTDKKTHGALDYGIGAKYFLSDSFALRADARHVYSKVSSRSFNDALYTVGAYIPFGGAQPAMKPVEPAPAPAPVVEVPKAVEKPAPVAPTSKISVSPTSILKGEPATLSWTSQNASKCEIQPGIGPVATEGSMSITPADNTSYMLKCAGDGGVASSSTLIGVSMPAPPPAPVVEAAQPKASAAAERFCSKPAVLAIVFDTNKSDIKPKYDADLKALSDFLAEFPNAKGEISGHTDNVGGKDFNQKLSQRRADSVKNYMVKKYGVDAARVTAKGYGLTKPVASNKTKEGKAKNRRIEANFVCEEKK
jgi:OmpA-OmpF porin, OOP family